MQDVRKRDNHITKNMTAFDFGYKKSWKIKSPVAVVGNVTFSIFTGIWPSNDRIDDIGRNHVDGEIYKLDIYG